MPVTDGQRVNVFDRRILGAVDFDQRLLSFLESGQKRHFKGMLTGASSVTDVGTWLSPVTVVDGAGVNDLTFGQMFGTDGSGEYVSVNGADPRLVNVPFEDAGVTYYMATAAAEVPVEIQTDTETGDHAYDYHRKEIGHRAEPTAVVDGGAFLTITIGNHALDGADDFTGRTAIVFLKNPESPAAATAIESVIVAGTTLVTVGVLGQASPSTTASDYEVVLVGPTITRFVGLAALAGWAFIGTVVGGGSPRVFDTSSQTSVVPLNELSALSSELLSRGWITRPTVAIQAVGTQIAITSTSTVYTNGRILTAPTGAVFNAFPINSDIWISYNIIAGDFNLFTTWDTANSGTNVPLVWAKTNGTSQVSLDTLERIGRIVKEFPESVLLTVSGETEHRGAYSSLRAVLARIGSLQDSAAIPPRSFRVEVIGRIQENATTIVNDVDFFDAVNVHFTGARGRAGTTPNAGSTIEWSDNASALFALPSGATMAGWTFENIKFIHTGGAPSAASVAVVHNQAGATVNDLMFKGCVFGNTTGDLPAAYYSDSTSNRLVFDDCDFKCADVAIRQTATAANGIQGLTVRDCQVDQTGLTPVGATRGFIRDDVTGAGGTEATKWRIKDNDADLAGPFVHVEELIGGRIKDNEIIIRNVNTRAIQVGDSGNIVRKVWVNDNSVEYPGAALFTLDGAVVVYASGTRDVGTGELAGVFVNNNHVEGTGYAPGNGTGLRVSGSSADGTIASHNMVSKFTTGMECGSSGTTNAKSVIFAGNVVEGGALAYHIRGLNGSSFYGNIGKTQNAVSTVIDCDAGADCVFFGNIADSTGTVNSSALNVATDADQSVWVGNFLKGTGTGTAISANNNNNPVFTGNLIHGDQLFTGVSGLLYTGNQSTDTSALEFVGGGVTSVFTGNRFNGNIGSSGNELPDGAVVSGNTLLGVVFNGSRLVMSGNHITDQTTTNSFGASSEYMAITGNLWRDAPNFDAASVNSALTGNVFEDVDAWSLDTNQMALTGNLIRPALTLAAGSNDIAAVGNRLNGGAITDSGTGNTVVSNDI